jgi:uncharacterized protein (TIGR00255 family)
MLKSMTGFGRAMTEADGMQWTIEVASVNSRFLDVAARLPRALAGTEFALRKRIGSRLSRGKVTLTVTWESLPNEVAGVRINAPLAKAYIKQLRELQSSSGVSGEVTIDLIAALPDLFSSATDSDDRESREATLLGALDLALDKLETMREAEGEKLGNDVVGRLETIHAELGHIESEAEAYARALAEKVKERVSQLFEDVTIEPQRLAQEAAFLAERADITEERVRLSAHIQEFQATLKKGGQVGRRFNFLLQEMVRETNTIGSKTGELTVIQRVMRIKEELEKIREQVQNLE